VRIPRVLRTSSFRLTLFYGVPTLLGYLLLFGIVFWSTRHFMEQQIDASVAGELAEIRAAAPTDTLPQLRDVVESLSVRSPDFFYLLEDAGGEVVAGNLPSMPPLEGIQQWAGSGHRHHLTGIRGQGRLAGNGAYLFVGLSTVQLHEMQEAVVHAFLWGFLLAMLLALAGGTATSLWILRRIESVSETSREIVRGDLERRIPDRGTRDEFDHLAASLNAMLDRIQALMEGLRQVSNDIAHDLRTPLTRLRQRLELARHRAEGPGDSDDSDDSGSAGSAGSSGSSSSSSNSSNIIDPAIRDVDAILETFAALLRIAQIESGSRKAGFCRVDLAEVLRTVIELYQPALDEAGRPVELEIEAAPRVRGDRELLTQLFANLVDNALRHSGPNARIRLTVERQGERIAVIVTDSGPGIPVEWRDKVLHRFFRLERSRSTPGSGLGLSLAHAIATLHESALVLGDAQPGLRVTVLLEPWTDAPAMLRKT
jgi:signal transduction histidine kinase